MREIRDLLPGATLHLSLFPEGEDILPWMARIEWRMGPHSYNASAIAKALPEALTALKEKIEADPPVKRAATPEDF